MSAGDLARADVESAAVPTKTGRPPLPANERLGRKIVTYVTPEMYAEARKVADSEGLTISEWLRLRLTAPE